MGKVGKEVNQADSAKNVFEARAKKIFKDKNAFNLNYIPEHILVRKEFDKVINFFDDCLHYQLPQDLIIVGPAGVGKTLATEFYSKAAKSYAKRGIDFHYFYINCREIKNPYTFYQFLLSQLGFQIKRGFGIDELTRKFIEKTKGYRHLVLAIDEIDKLFAFSADRANDILYVITRIKNSSTISTVMISNNTKLMEMFDPSVNSSLNPILLSLSPYTPEELYEILEYRAEKGLKIYDSSLLKYISAYTAKESGDARLAIKLLFNAAKLAEDEGKDKVTEKEVKRCIEETRREIELGAVERLSRNQLMVLKSLTGINKKLIPVTESYNTYKGICEKLGEDFLSYVQYWRVLNSLSK
ncbi:MAG: Cdc6/Cdc18 family protein, partial [Elusimicrobiota bacterium]